MKNIFTLIITIIIAVAMLSSCARSVSIHQAAGGGFKGVRSVR